MYEGKSKSTGTFKKKNIYCKYTDTKLIELLKVIPIDFNAPISAFHKLIPSQKGFLVASLTSFAPRKFLQRIVTADETWVYHYEPESKAQSVAWKHPT
jgi:hypothetical protein